MKCIICGRYMRLLGERFSNEHLDSFEDVWKCDNHDFEREGR